MRAEISVTEPQKQNHALKAGPEILSRNKSGKNKTKVEPGTDQRERRNKKTKKQRQKHTFSKRLSAYTNSACRSTGVMLLMNPTPDVFRDPMTRPARQVGSDAARFRCWLATPFPCRTFARASTKSYTRDRYSQQSAYSMDDMS